MNMEIQVVTFVSVIITFLTILFLYLTFNYHRKTTLTPLPGSLGWPIVGETLVFLSDFRKGVPHRFFQDRVKKYASNIFKTSLFGEAMIVFCGSEGNKFIFSNEGTLFGSSKTLSVRNLFPDFKVEEVKKVKMLLLRFLKQSSTHKLIGVMDLIAKQQLDLDAAQKDHIKASSLVQNYVFSVAYQLLLGGNSDDTTKLKHQLDVISDGFISSVTLIPFTPYSRAIKAVRSVHKKIREVIMQRKSDVKENIPMTQQNLLSDMLNSTTEEVVFEDEAVAAAMITGILFTSYTTPHVVLVFLVKYLAVLPNVYIEVRKEQTEIAMSKQQGELLNWDDIQKMKYSWNVASEVLRLLPPSHGSYRKAIKDFTYEGFFIPEGSKIYASPHSTHMSSNYFPDPEKFDPSRFEGKAPAPFSYVPFGGGPRICPGMLFARFEILVFLHNLITQFKWEMLIPKEKTIFDTQPRPEHGLPIKLWDCGTKTL